MRFVLASALMAFCAAAPAAGVSGIWHGMLEGAPFFLELRPDGSGTLDGDPIRYRQEGDHLLVEVNGALVDYGFELKKDGLHVSGGDLTARARARAGSAAKTP